MIKNRPITGSEIERLRATWMKFFRESGARFLVSPHNTRDFYINVVTGSMGVAIEGRGLGVTAEERYSSKEFDGRAAISVPFRPYCGEIASVDINSDRVGGRTFYLFSSPSALRRSPLHGLRADHEYIRVPMRVMRNLG